MKHGGLAAFLVAAPVWSMAYAGGVVGPADTVYELSYAGGFVA